MFEAHTEHPTTTEFPIPSEKGDPQWLASVRQDLDAGCYLAFEDVEGSAPEVIALEQGWTRIGRSIAADIRFDDPTVSRRHALVVWEEDSLRVLDDRSLNGVFLNGELVEWARLGDGDELAIGRYRLFVLEA
jgi:hypothetical protein